MLAAARSEGWGDSVETESVVTGLCRGALDGVIRQSVITSAVRRGDDVDAVLGELSKRRETRNRIGYVIGLAGGPGRLPRTEHVDAEHLDGWNRGTHGTPVGLDLSATVRAAREACAELTGYSW